MAQPIYCDFEGCGEHADVIVSTLDPTDAQTSAWCTPHWAEFAGMVSDAAREAAAAYEPPAAEPQPEPDPDAADQAVIDAATGRLAAFGLTPTEVQAVLAAEADTEQEPAGAPTAAAEVVAMESPSEQASAALVAAGEPTEGIEQAAPPETVAGQQGPPESPDPANVVKRGTSPSRRRHEARKREREQQQEGAQP